MTEADVFGDAEDYEDAWPHDVVVEQWLLGAMIASPEAIGDAVAAGWHPRDCWRPQHADIGMALVGMYGADERIDPITLREWMGDGAFRGRFRPDYLLDLIHEPGVVVSNAGVYAAKVHALAMRRRLLELAARLRQAGLDTGGPAVADIVAMAEGELARVVGELDDGDYGEDPRDFAADEQAAAHNWVVAGVLDAMERVVVTGLEGDGKSVWGFQWAVCAAAGIHPLIPPGDGRITPVRAVYADLEVPRGEAVRRMRWLKEHADAAGWDPSMLRIWNRPEGVDLRTAEGQHRMTQVIRRHRPGLVVAGPLYKMGLDEAERAEHKLVTDYWDRIRVRYGCAVWLESHTPLAQGTASRAMRPMGSGVWTRWPEFGFALKRAKAGADEWRLQRFRGDRVRGRAWPRSIWWRAGHGWPWGSTWPDGWWDRPLPVAAADGRDEPAARRQQDRNPQPTTPPF